MQKTNQLRRLLFSLFQGLWQCVSVGAPAQMVPPPAPQPNVVAEHLSNTDATEKFKFQRIPGPSTNDLAGASKFVIVDGEQDSNSGGLAKVNDGVTPTVEDDPSRNFFFGPGSQGGRLRIDLPRRCSVAEFNTYSWHPNTRAAQVYTLYVSSGGAGVVLNPKNGVDPKTCGWTVVARVDTRPKTGETGGQYAVAVRPGNSPLLNDVRHLLMLIEPTELDDDFGNTFFSEIDVLDVAGSSK